MIQVERLVKSYRAGATAIHVLSDVSLRIDDGEYVAIVGASGSGKSTLLNILGLLDNYDSGRYLLGDQDTHGLTDTAAARMRNRMIGFVFQSFQLLPHKCAWENVALPLTYANVGRIERRRRAHALLERLGLSDRVDAMPHQLSGGQQQRVAIARALATDPLLVLADEPTGNLDSENTREVLALLGEIHAHGRTVVVVTHQPEIAQTAERVIRVHDGTVIESTAPLPIAGAS